MGKRYYWLKLPEDFFGDKAIKRLRKIAGGDTYVIIYLKMEIRSEQEYFMPDMNIGSETAVAERVRRCRAKKQSESLQCNAPETQVKQNGNGEIDIDREIEIEIEKDIYLSILDGESKENLSTFQQSAQPPTLLEVKQYAEQKGIHTDVQKFYSYYSERGWKTKNGQPITNWKGTLAYWGKTDGTCQGKRKPETYVSENAAAYESLIYNLQEHDDSDKA